MFEISKSNSLSDLIKSTILLSNYQPEGFESKAARIINLDGEPAIIVFGKTEKDAEHFALRIAGLLEASTGLHYEIAIKLMRAAKKKWQPTEPEDDSQGLPEPNPDE